MDTIMSTASVRSQLLSLQHLSMEELIEKWKMLFHKDPPQYGEVFMRRRLAHRIQELAYGGLSEAAVKKINSINDPIHRSRNGLRVGTVIVKTWHDTKFYLIGFHQIR